MLGDEEKVKEPARIQEKVDEEEENLDEQR